MSNDLANTLRPVSEPVVLDGVYSDDQHRRLLETVRREGPWPLILAQTFKSPEEVIATMSGMLPPGVTPTMDMFLTPCFRGFLAQGGACLYDGLEDTFHNVGFLQKAKAYWNAQYATPTMMLFNIQGPCGSQDPGHLDGVSFRGLTYQNTPVWLLNMMGKSGLFKPWLKKMAQVITWYYDNPQGGGFTYWPDGPLGQPKRLATPMWNRGVVVQNEMMYHRGEPNGPAEQRHPQGLALHSLFGADPEVEDGWRITTDGAEIQKVAASEMRFLVHWNAEVFADMAELKAVMDHTDDLTVERVVDTFLKDLRSRGVEVATPSDPLRDLTFIQTLTANYDIGTPRIYPAEAPGPHQLAA
ncbi:hypothetical protein [Caulobacter sp. Root343]|uniref:hypothetical protein n=1 Tax=Caulobacter sp. Root343 TaxID=1736520 RepID=UPI000A5E06F2|nr:hypothetical protein [Caulobacter sp. Root343]